MDLKKFEEDLMCALARPEEWRVGGGGAYLLHSHTGVRVHTHGETFRPGTTFAGAHVICVAPLETATRCRTAVDKRESEARRKSFARDREEFLEAFSGFRTPLMQPNG